MSSFAAPRSKPPTGPTPPSDLSPLSSLSDQIETEPMQLPLPSSADTRTQNKENDPVESTIVPPGKLMDTFKVFSNFYMCSYIY